VLLVVIIVALVLIARLWPLRRLPPPLPVLETLPELADVE
jgi:hypothetical protein